MVLMMKPRTAMSPVMTPVMAIDFVLFQKIQAYHRFMRLILFKAIIHYKFEHYE